MKLGPKFCLLIIVAFMSFLVSSPLHAQEGGQVKFENLTRQDGVSGSEIRNVIQDEQGRIWFGTRYNGVNVYDGYEIRVFTHDPNDPQSLAGDPAFSVQRQPGHNLGLNTGRRLKQI